MNLNNVFFLLLLVVIILFLKFKSKDNFTNSNTEDSLDFIESIEAFGVPPCFNYSIYNYSIIKMDEAVGDIVKKALKDNNLKAKIKNKMVLIYDKIQTNDELKTYLKFINLINEDGLPIFINKSESVVLANEVKIILITDKTYQI